MKTISLTFGLISIGMEAPSAFAIQLTTHHIIDELSIASTSFDNVLQTCMITKLSRLTLASWITAVSQGFC